MSLLLIQVRASRFGLFVKHSILVHSYMVGASSLEATACKKVRQKVTRYLSMIVKDVLWGLCTHLGRIKVCVDNNNKTIR